MCLAIPGQIVEIVDAAKYVAKVDFAGVRRDVNTFLMQPAGAEVGDWVLVHVGFALSRIDEQEAARTLRFLESLGQDYEDERKAFGDSRIE